MPVDDRGAVGVRNGQTTGEYGQLRRRRKRQSGGATFVVVMQSVP